MRRIGQSLRCHRNTFRLKSIMPWPSCKASFPSSILRSRSPKTVTRNGFSTPWILILVEPLRVKDAPETPFTAGASASSLGDEQETPVCEKCLVVGVYRRPLCPPMPYWTGRQPANRSLVDLRSHLRLLFVSRTAFPALSVHVADAASPKTARFSIRRLTSPGVMHSALGWSLPFISQHWPSRRSGSGPGWPSLCLKLRHFRL